VGDLRDNGKFSEFAEQLEAAEAPDMEMAQADQMELSI
jgi:hypothetical protein